MKKLIIFYAIAFATASAHSLLAQTESTTTGLRDHGTTVPTSTESTKPPPTSTTETPDTKQVSTLVDSPRSESTRADEKRSDAAPAEPAEAQPKLPTTPLKIGTATVTAEVADNEKSRTMGLMFRKGLEKDHGMLFVMPRVGPVGFWMKNTSIPLSIAYIDKNGRIMEIHDLEPHNEKPVRSQFPHIAYALEMRRGWFSDNAILPGTVISGIPSS